MKIKQVTSFYLYIYTNINQMVDILLFMYDVYALQKLHIMRYGMLHMLTHSCYFKSTFFEIAILKHLESINKHK